LLTLNNNSSITASSTGAGGGGSIQISTDLAVIFPNSFIQANASNSFGGDIFFSSEYFFSTPSSITATSELGPQFNGTVVLNSTSVPPSAFTTIISEPLFPRPGLNCETASKDITYQGTGGMPETLKDSYEPSDFLKPIPVQTTRTFTDLETGEQIPLIEAVGWKNNPDGTISFVTNRADAVQYAYADNPCNVLNSH
jgi:hypothetical protein